MRTDPIHSKHQERKNNPLPELGDVEYVLDAGEQGLYHLGLPAGGLDFFHGALAELMRTHGNFASSTHPYRAP